MKLGVDLLKPEAQFTNMHGKNVRMLWTLDGPFSRANHSYRLTSPQVYFDNTGFIDVLAQGKGQLSRWPMRVPLRLRAKAIAGVGDARDTKAGWTAGGGIEAHISGPWSAKLEYLYVDLGRGGSVLGSDSKFQTNIVRVGLNYRF